MRLSTDSRRLRSRATIYLIEQAGAEKTPEARRTYAAAARLARASVRAAGRVAVRGSQPGFLRVMGACGGSGLPIVVDVRPVVLK